MIICGPGFCKDFSGFLVWFSAVLSSSAERSYATPSTDNPSPPPITAAISAVPSVLSQHKLPWIHSISHIRVLVPYTRYIYISFRIAGLVLYSAVFSVQRHLVVVVVIVGCLFSFDSPVLRSNSAPSIVYGIRFAVLYR